MTNPSTGLVLTGGSLKGICGETGLLMALDDVNYKVDAIMGTSAGSLVGAMYASGLSGREIFECIKKMRKKDYIDPDWLRLLVAPLTLFRGWHGLIKGDGLLRWLRANIPVELIEDCKTPLHICVTNVSREEPQVKSSGPIADWVRASTSIPFAFRMHMVDGEYYVDGGAVNNNPLDELVERTPQLERYIIGTTLRVVKPEGEVDNKFRQKVFTPLGLLDKIIGAISSELRQENMESCGKDVRIIKLSPGSIHLDEIDKAEEAVLKAYKDATEQIKSGILD